MRCVLGGVASALIGNVLLASGEQRVYSSCDTDVTSPEEPAAARSPQEARRRAARRPSWKRQSACLSWQTLPSQRTFAASAERPWRRLWWSGGESEARMGFFHLSALSGNTFCPGFPECLQTKGKVVGAEGHCELNDNAEL